MDSCLLRLLSLKFLFSRFGLQVFFFPGGLSLHSLSQFLADLSSSLVLGACRSRFFLSFCFFCFFLPALALAAAIRTRAPNLLSREPLVAGILLLYYII